MARYFAGVSDKITTGNISYANGEIIGIFARIYPTSVAVTKEILAKSQSASAANYDLRQAASGKLDFYYRNSADTAYDDWRTTDIVLSINLWQSVALAYTFGTGSSIALYVNAVLKAGSWIAQAGNDIPYTGTNPMLIGIFQDGTNPWIGRIAEVALWKGHTLTQAEVTALHNGARILSIAPAYLKGYWPLWGVATPEPDLSGNAYHGTVTGAVLADHAPVSRYAPMPRPPVTHAELVIEYINVSDSGIGTDTILGIEEWLATYDTGAGTDTVYLQGELQIDGNPLPHIQRVHVSEPSNLSSKPLLEGLPSRRWVGKQGRTADFEGWTESLTILETVKALADGAAHWIQLPDGTAFSAHITRVDPHHPTSPDEYPYTLHADERMD